MFKSVVFCALLATAMAVPAPNTVLNCNESNDMLSCYAVKAITVLDRASRSADVNLVDGVSFVRETPVERSSRALKSETELMSGLPQDAVEKTLALATMVYENAANFLKSHSLKINLPEAAAAGRSLGLEEGKKNKKVLMPLMAAAGVKLLALAPLLLGGLVILVTKAVVVSKIALLVAGILAFQKFFGAGSHSGFGSLFGKTQGGYAPAPVYDAPAASYGAPVQQGGYNYKRSFAEKEAAQQLAYSAQAPTADNH